LDADAALALADLADEPLEGGRRLRRLRLLAREQLLQDRGRSDIAAAECRQHMIEVGHVERARGGRHRLVRRLLLLRAAQLPLEQLPAQLERDPALLALDVAADLTARAGGLHEREPRAEERRVGK